jgi:plasmid maintenance system antidote protein VapI
MPETVESIEFAPEILEKEMNNKNISQSELNTLAGFKSHNAVNKIINGKRQATATELLRFSKILGVPAEAFAKTQE